MALSAQASRLLKIISREVNDDPFDNPDRLADVDMVERSFGDRRAYVAALAELVAIGIVRVSESGAYLKLT